MKMRTTEKILQTMNSWQSGEVIAMRRKKCSGASSHPTDNDLSLILTVGKINYLIQVLVLAKQQP